MSVVARDVSQFLESHRSSMRASIPTTAIGFDKFLREGVPGSVASTVGEMLELTREELASLLHISPSTLDRRLAGGGRFTGAEADALYRVLGTLGVALRVLKTPTNMASWLRRAQPGLAGEVPLDLLGTSAGTEAVNLLLEQIYHGIVA